MAATVTENRTFDKKRQKLLKKKKKSCKVPIATKL
jgi:hypothetical protein